MEDGSDLFLSLTGNYTRSRWLGLPLDAVAAGSAAGPSPSVPQPLACLLAKLSTAEALATPGLFIHTVQEVLRPAGRGGAHPEGSSSDEPAPGRVTQRALLTRLWPLVEALEGGGAIPEVGGCRRMQCQCFPSNPPMNLPPAFFSQATSPHEAAALLLVMLGELPRALIPMPAIMLIEAAVEAGQVRS